MKVHDIFSELSSETRLEMLLSLSQGPMKFTQISEKFGITSPEASRQLHRLVDAKLVEKNVDGSYSLSIFGRLTLSCISDLRFVSEKSDYFSSHDSTLIPQDLLSRIDDMSSGGVITGEFQILDAIDKRFDGILEYFWYMTDDFPRHFIGRSEKRIEAGVNFRIIFPEKLLSDLYSSFSSIITDNVEFRVLSDVRMLVDANDKFARVALPSADGKIDHSATILGSDPRFKDWCRELFEFYWKKAEPYTP